MITRRATRRHYLFRPDRDGTMQQIYWYTTAVLAAKFGVRLHAVQVLSTHMHEVLTDVEGKLPAFLRERNRLFANALKCHRGWPEEVFQRAPASYVELHGAAAIASEIGYTLANCVEAGLVNDPIEWPGVSVLVDDIGRRVVEVARPDAYFDPTNAAWPPLVSIAIAMPDEVERAHGARAPEYLRSAVRRAVARARCAASAAGRRVADSVAKLFAVPFTRRSRSFEPFGARDPSFATGGDRERATAARAALREFRALYRKALEALRRGLHEVAFPPGTWRWRTELLPASLMIMVRPQCQSGLPGLPASANDASGVSK